MYINCKSQSPSASKNSIKLDIIQFIRLCREKSKDDTQRVEDLIDKCRARMNKKQIRKNNSQHLKTEENTKKVTKLPHNKSITRIGKRWQQSQTRYNSKQKLEKRESTKSLHLQKIFQQKQEPSIFWDIDSMIPKEVPLVRKHSKKNKLKVITSNGQLRAEIKTKDKKEAQKGCEPCTIDISEPIYEQVQRGGVFNESESPGRVSIRKSKSKVSKTKKEMSLITKHGWDIKTNNKWDAIFNI